MEWERELKKHILKLIQQFDPDATIDGIHLIGVQFPELEDLSQFSIEELGKIYAFSIMREDYEGAKLIHDELDKRKCKINLEINEKTKEGVLNICVEPIVGVEHVKINLKVLKDGLCIDWDKEDNNE